ncbi:MAG: glycosyltransferase [Flavobacteriales bacterium]|nr:glycosyltransferase [Flavobacteriales bacterium]
MPRVLRIINRFNLGGPTFNVSYLSKYMSDDYETMLIGGEKEESEDSSLFILEKLGLNPLLIPEMKRSLNPLNDLKAYFKIRKIIKEFKPDIVHTHAAKSGALGRLAAYHCKVPIIVHTFHGHVFHSYFSTIITSVFKIIERYLASISTQIIAISEIQKKELVNIHKISAENKTSIVPLGFDLSKFKEDKQKKREAFRTKFNIKENDIVISIIGRLAPIKNHKLFLESIEYIVQKTNKNIKALIVGDGQEKAKLQTLTSELDLDFTEKEFNRDSQVIAYTSWIKEVDEVLAGSDIVALTSFNEGTPVSLIEAQAAGKPIVSTRVGGIENIVNENITALLSPSDDLNAFKLNLLELIENDSKREEMTKSTSGKSTKEFEYQTLCSNMEWLYEQLIKMTNRD